MDFRVDLSIYRGPLDLLLYLVRKHELDILDIPIALVTEQYLAYLDVIRELDVNAVGDFLALASTLVEIKSQQVLPRADEVDDAVEDPREELVRRLLEYKKYRDAASILEEQGRQWQLQYPRIESDLPARERDLAEEPIHEVELWDLVIAFARIVRENEAARPSNIVYDETPIRVYMQRIFDRVQEQQHLGFVDLFTPGMHKSRLVGIFLACLELVRHGHVRLEQNRLFGEIWLSARADSAGPLELAEADNYDHATQ